MASHKIAVVGTGYVGLVAGACFAELGHNVICVDSNEQKIKTLKEGRIPIFEPGLEELVQRNVKAQRLSFSTDLADAVKKSEIIFIAVGTPPRQNGEADLSFVEKVTRQIAEAATEPKIVVEKSTVPVETGEKVLEVLKRHNSHKVNFDVVSNPEFLREGSAVEDFLKPDRVVIGTDSEHARKLLEEIYKPLKAPIVFTDVKSAEIIKHASNSFLATKISFINAVANICEATGADIKKVAEGMGLDKRIGKSFLNAGIGYGGSCFPKDVEAFISIASKHGYDFALLGEVQKLNLFQRQHFVKKLSEALWNVKGKTVAVLGLAFKPNTDDMRCAPSVEIIKMLQKDGAKIRVFDPVAMEKAKAELKDIKDIVFCKDAFDALNGADALALLTEWEDFKNLDLEKAKRLMKGHVFADGRNVFERKLVEDHGFVYIGVGR